MNSRLRRSRTFWPDALTVAGVGEGHTHNVAPRYKRMFMLAMVVFVSLTLAVAAIWWRIVLSGPYRDQQLQQIREEVRVGQCDLLDTFPEDLPSLQRARAKYHCGPGIPHGLLTPEEQALLPTPAPSSPVPFVQPDVGQAAIPSAPQPPVYAPTAPRETPPPLVDLGPITGQVCDLAGVCVG